MNDAHNNPGNLVACSMHHGVGVSVYDGVRRSRVVRLIIGLINFYALYMI
jgi:hypothetical protein